jgi:hypothetical protein
VSVFFCGLCVGVIIGLIFGPDSEREHAAKVDGWISGYRFARPKQTPNLHRETPNMTERSEDALKAKGKSTMTDEQIKHMTERFLSWKLPENFSPDAGISFSPEFNVEWNAKQGLPPQRHEPVGTNLFGYEQARAMVQHMVEGLPK